MVSCILLRSATEWVSMPRAKKTLRYDCLYVHIAVLELKEQRLESG
jgi:hypothetical protein